MAPFDRNLTFAAIDLTVLLETTPEKMFRLLGKILQLFDQGINIFQDAYTQERHGMAHTRYFAISLGAVAGSTPLHP